eukprot:m.235065 g.235065  ORF g.235065 m.235065 type:complete len:96 (+) comp12758_c0_seq1:28-315(+)
MAWSSMAGVVPCFDRKRKQEEDDSCAKRAATCDREFTFYSAPVPAAMMDFSVVGAVSMNPATPPSASQSPQTMEVCGAAQLDFYPGSWRRSCNGW